MQVVISLCLIWCCAIVKTEDEIKCDKNKGSKQSPIDINTSKVQKVTRPSLKWSEGYTMLPKFWEITNTGHTLQLQGDFDKKPQISGGNLGATYTFQQLHFHWGAADVGSEHSVNKYRYPLEMHAVHTQDSNPDAKNYTVITYFFEVSLDTNPIMKVILQPSLRVAEESKNRRLINPFPLNKFFGDPLDKYFSYEGSLTTPPYTESVNWIIFHTPLFLSQRQMDTFHAAAELDHHWKNNYRCCKPLNDRKVELVTQQPNRGSRASLVRRFGHPQKTRENFTEFQKLFLARLLNLH